MSPIENLINFNIKNIVKLFRRGNITKMYEEIYEVAERLALHEMEKKNSIIMERLNKEQAPKEFFIKYFGKIMDIEIEGLNTTRTK